MIVSLNTGGWAGGGNKKGPDWMTLQSNSKSVYIGEEDAAGVGDVDIDGGGGIGIYGGSVGVQQNSWSS